MAGGTSSNQNSLVITITGVPQSVLPEITPTPEYESVWFYNSLNNTWGCIVAKSQSTSPITISATGYKPVIRTFETLGNESMTIEMETLKYVSNLSDGTTTYIIKDAEARQILDNFDCGTMS